MRQIVSLALCLLCLPISAPAQAEDLLAFPVDCTLGQDCLTVHYLDMDPSDKAADPYCGKKTYDGHKGTDFTLLNRAQLQKGVNVLATADGKILRLRDGEDDTPKSKEQIKAIKEAGKECGNGIVIQHSNKMQSFYCHLKKGSIKVKIGQDIKKGDPIAQIGESGQSEFPHLHISIIKDGTYIDPFTGATNQEGCGIKHKTLWEKTIPYEAFTLFDQAFTNTVPDFDQIKTGFYESAKTLPLKSEALIYWAGLYHAIKDDELHMKIIDPKGQVFVEKTQTLPRNKQKPSYYYVGKKTRNTKLMPGTYTAITTFIRRQNGQIQAKKTYSKEIEVR